MPLLMVGRSASSDYICDANIEGRSVTCRCWGPAVRLCPEEAAKDGPLWSSAVHGHPR